MGMSLLRPALMDIGLVHRGIPKRHLDHGIFPQVSSPASRTGQVEQAVFSTFSRHPSQRPIDRRWDRSRGLVSKPAPKTIAREMTWRRDQPIVFAEVPGSRRWKTRRPGESEGAPSVSPSKPMEHSRIKGEIRISNANISQNEHLRDVNQQLIKERDDAKFQLEQEKKRVTVSEKKQAIDTLRIAQLESTNARLQKEHDENSQLQAFMRHSFEGQLAVRDRELQEVRIALRGKTEEMMDTRMKLTETQERFLNVQAEEQRKAEAVARGEVEERKNNANRSLEEARGFAKARKLEYDTAARATQQYSEHIRRAFVKAQSELSERLGAIAEVQREEIAKFAHEARKAMDFRETERGKYVSYNQLWQKMGRLGGEFSKQLRELGASLAPAETLWALSSDNFLLYTQAQRDQLQRKYPDLYTKLTALWSERQADARGQREAIETFQHDLEAVSSEITRLGHISRESTRYQRFPEASKGHTAIRLAATFLNERPITEYLDQIERNIDGLKNELEASTQVDVSSKLNAKKNSLRREHGVLVLVLKYFRKLRMLEELKMMSNKPMPEKVIYFILQEVESILDRASRMILESEKDEGTHSRKDHNMMSRTDFNTTRRNVHQQLADIELLVRKKFILHLRLGRESREDQLADEWIKREFANSRSAAEDFPRIMVRMLSDAVNKSLPETRGSTSGRRLTIYPSERVIKSVSVRTGTDKIPSVPELRIRRDRQTRKRLKRADKTRAKNEETKQDGKTTHDVSFVTTESPLGKRSANSSISDSGTGASRGMTRPTDSSDGSKRGARIDLERAAGRSRKMGKVANPVHQSRSRSRSSRSKGTAPTVTFTPTVPQQAPAFYWSEVSDHADLGDRDDAPTASSYFANGINEGQKTITCDGSSQYRDDTCLTAEGGHLQSTSKVELSSRPHASLSDGSTSTSRDPAAAIMNLPLRAREVGEDFARAADPGAGSLSFQIPAEEFRGVTTDPASRKEVHWTHKLYRNAHGKAPSVHYCTKLEQAEAQAVTFLDEEIIGFDIEWEMYSSPGTSNIKSCVSLIQVAAEDRIGLFHVSLFAGDTPEQLMPNSLRKLLQSKTVIKAGVNIGGDARRLKQCLNVDMAGLVELSRLYRVVQYSRTAPQQVNRKLVSLAEQVQSIFLLPLKKDAVRTSHWARRLDMAQTDYAAADAYAGFRLYHALEAQRETLDPTPSPVPFLEEEQPSLLVPCLKGDQNWKATSSKKKRGVVGRTEDLAGREDVDDEFFDAVESLEHLEISDQPFSSAAGVPLSGLSVSYPTLPQREDSTATAAVQHQLHLVQQETDTVACTKSTRRQGPPASKEVAQADAWVTSWRASLPPEYNLKAPLPSLRAYHLWHKQGLDCVQVASLLRETPLSLQTVANYVMQALKEEPVLPFDHERAREVLQILPKNAHGRYWKLVECLKQ